MTTIPRTVCLLTGLLLIMSVATASEVVRITTPMRLLTAADIDDSFEVLRSERQCSDDKSCAAARRDEERAVLLSGTGSGIIRATCQIKEAAHAGVHGELRIYGRVKGGEADVAQWFRLDFAGHQWPAGGGSKNGLDADFDWFGPWDGPRNWPNVSVSRSDGGALRTPLIDERELDMVAAARRVTISASVSDHPVVHQYQMRDFARVFEGCRRELVMRIGLQLVSQLKALPAVCTPGECPAPE